MHWGQKFQNRENTGSVLSRSLVVLCGPEGNFT